MRIFVLILLSVWCRSINAQINKASTDSSWDCYFPCNLTIPAKFPGGIKSWSKYLRANINPNLGNKYIDIPKNKKSTQVTVHIYFRINKWGYVDTAFVSEDSIKVHPKLVAEAIRIIKASSRWVAARLNNHRTTYLNRQAITWQVSKY